MSTKQVTPTEQCIADLEDHHEGAHDVTDLMHLWYHTRPGSGHEKHLIPGLVQQAIMIGALTYEHEAAMLHHAWSYPEFPSQYLDRYEWLELFGTIGYLHNDTYVKQHEGEAVLYRGASPEHQTGMSWTTDRDVAVMFATRWSRKDGQIYTLNDVPASAILARFDERGEHEVVVDFDELEDQ